MKKELFPPPYTHKHPPIRNVNDLLSEKLATGQKIADKVAHLVGSWKFIIIQSAMLTIWVVLNLMAFINHWDPYPFILLNLFLSLQAAYTAPVLMMSQNRLAEKDRIEAHNDYQVNLKSEEEVRAILKHLHAQNNALAELLGILSKKNHPNK